MILAPHLYRCPECNNLKFKKESYVTIAKTARNENEPDHVETIEYEFSCAKCGFLIDFKESI